MAVPTGNRLLPALGVVAALLSAVVLVRSCHWGERPGPTGAQLPKAPAADADSPAETLRSLTARVADMTTTMQALVQENQRLRGDHREMEATVTRRVTESLGREQAAQESQALSELRRRMEDLSTKVSMPPKPMPAAAELPVGLGLEGAEAVVWVEPLDGAATGAAASLLHRAVATMTVGSEAAGSSAAPRAEAKDRKPERAALIPYYTINRNATLIGSTAMTALIGRIPVKGRVQDPMPFKVIVGADNLAANGITIPGVAGMVASGVALGDWTLSCASGDITSMSFVFQDGTIRTVSAGDPGAAEGNAAMSEERKRLGWISDEHGVPCVSGRRITDAPAFLTQRILAGAVEAGAAAASRGETTSSVTSLGGSLTTVTGELARHAGYQALGGGAHEVSQWLRDREEQSFDVVYVRPGAAVALHLEREIRIDYDREGRKVSHVQQAIDPYRRARLD